MPTVLNRKFNPDRISDKTEGPYPLRLIRLCLRELWKFIEDPTLIFGGTGGGGTGSGPAASLPTRVMVEWRANGPYRVDTAVDGAWVVPTACEIRKLELWRGTAGISGSTIIDLNRRHIGTAAGTESSLYATQANRPTLAYNDPDGLTPCNLPDTISLQEGDVVTIDCDQRDTGRPYDFALILEAA